MSEVNLSKDIQDTGYGERHFKQVGNPVTGAAYVEFPAGAAGAADALEVTQILVKTAVQDLDTKTGEVQANPTANTLLGRLKDLLTGIILAAGTNLIGKVGIDQTTPGTTNNVTVHTPIYIIASDSVSLPASSLAQVLAYNADGTLLTITVVYLGNTYIQTFTYTLGKITGISQWVKQ